MKLNKLTRMVWSMGLDLLHLIRLLIWLLHPPVKKTLHWFSLNLFHFDEYVFLVTSCNKLSVLLILFDWYWFYVNILLSFVVVILDTTNRKICRAIPGTFSSATLSIAESVSAPWLKVRHFSTSSNCRALELHTFKVSHAENT